MSTPPPAVSVILPTFNRGDVIGRAVASVQRQTFPDWELIIVDDGSSDGTADRIQTGDGRIVVHRQDNAGVYVARNNGLERARGRWITFLDSDDEWAPHFLALTTAFLGHHPEAGFVTTEFWEDWGAGPSVKHDAHEIGTKYPALARAVGSQLLQLPPGESDGYLRAYSSREPVGDWGRDALRRAGLPEDAQLYRGDIFRFMRFGYLNWLPVTVLTRRALETIGPFATHTRSAADFRFLGRLARAFPANMIAVPSATKYERAPGARSLTQDHLASGRGAYRFSVDHLGYFDELFTQEAPGDPEIQLLRCHHQLGAARAALRLGLRREAREHFRAAARLRQKLWWSYPGLALTTVVPSDRLAGATYRAGLRATDVGGRLARGELTPREALRRLARRFRRV